MKNYTLIGKGMFSSVYRKGKSNKVLIVSRDPVKECMSLCWFPESRLFPNIDRLSYNDDGTQTYTMQYYSKVTAPKRQLNGKSYRLYKALRDLQIENVFCESHSLYNEWMKAFKSLPNEFRIAKTALIEAVSALTNYGTDICFEISPRNIATSKAGNLILLDCFFLQSELNKRFC